MKSQNLKDENRSHEVLILAPTGQDSKLLAAALGEAKISSSVCRDVETLSARLRDEAGAVLVAEEALSSSAIVILNDRLEKQESWSDIPVVVMTTGGSNSSSSEVMFRKVVPSGSLTLIERPFRPLTLVSTLKVALRARKRQYQVRELLEFQRQATRLRDEFISVASHELRTPLTTIRMQAEYALRLKNKGVSAEEIAHKLEEFVTRTLTQVSGLTRLVDDMLDATRMTSGKFTLQKSTVELVGLVREVLARAEPMLEASGCAVQMTALAEVVGYWDPFRIEQVITNLLSNAARYAAGKQIWVSVHAQVNHAVFEVRDEGPGIPAEKREKIFGRFERAATGNEIHGLGLGLYISRKIVEAHSGTIRVESELGKGSTFIVELPLEDHSG